MKSRQQIAEELLGGALDDGQFARCPGAEKHSKQGGRRDFRVVLDGAPTGYCFHASCGGEVDAFNKELRRRIWLEEHDGVSPSYTPPGWEGVTPAPKADLKSRPPLDEYTLWEFTRGVPSVNEDWFRRRSPIDVECCDSEAFLGHLFNEGERVAIFTDWRSQGDFLYWVGRGGFRLSQQRGVKAVASKLPQGGAEGVWFLVQPVTGQWEINHKMNKTEHVAKYTRRSEVNVTAWRYFVLESDVINADQWLKVVANLPLPIAAVYTSGGRSIHALLKYEIASKPEWDMVRNMVRQIVCPLGADPAALTAVRLSRLPGCTRNGKLQRLLYLDPAPDKTEIRMQMELRA